MPPAMQPIWLLTDTPDLCISGEIHTGLHLHINLPITSHNFITFHFIYVTFIETTIYFDCSINCVTDLCISKMFGLQ
jgi:hypothetical protein